MFVNQHREAAYRVSNNVWMVDNLPKIKHGDT